MITTKVSIKFLSSPSPPCSWVVVCPIYLWNRLATEYVPPVPHGTVLLLARENALTLSVTAFTDDPTEAMYFESWQAAQAEASYHWPQLCTEFLIRPVRIQVKMTEVIMAPKAYPQRTEPVGEPLTLEQAKTLKHGSTVYNRHFLNADGATPITVKVTSVTTWKRRPDDIVIKASRGMYEHIMLTPSNFEDWTISDITKA